jgi:hypothetical protein
VALQSRVDGEAACRGVHARDVLAVVDVLQDQLVAIVPYERNMRSIVRLVSRSSSLL